MDGKLVFDQAEVRIHKQAALGVLDRAKDLGLDEEEALALLKTHSVVAAPILKVWWKRWKDGKAV
jgi:hypothetical protein